MSGAPGAEARAPGAHDVIVLGAGPAGLGAALRAASAGWRVLVIERAPLVGGLAASFAIDGIRVDLGSHRLHPSTDPVVLAELRRLLGSDLQRRTRRGRIAMAGRLLDFPLRAGDLVCRLPPGLALRLAADAVRPARAESAESFAERVRATLGATAGDRFYFPMARKLWGVEPEELSAELARRRVGARSLRSVARRVVAGGDGRWFCYPRRGFGQIAESLADAAEAAGAELRLGVGAAAIALGPSGAQVTLTGGGRAAAPALLSTIPLGRLSAISQPGPSPAVAARAAGLRMRSLLLVYLSFGGGRLTRFDAHYLPEPWTPVTRVSDPPNYRDGDDPADRTVVCAEIPCDAGDELWGADEVVLGGVVCEALRRAGLRAPRPRAVQVRRVAEAYPVLRRGDEATVAELVA